MLLAVAFVGMDMRSDLSELKSTGQVDDRGAEPVGWPDLERWRDRPGRVRMIGYMMDEHKPVHDGTRVDTFILLPEAGQFLHPAHRIRIGWWWCGRPIPPCSGIVSWCRLQEY